MTERLAKDLESNGMSDLGVLTARERQVYEMYKGLNGHEAMTYTAIARVLHQNPRTVGRTAERARERLGIVEAPNPRNTDAPLDPRIANHPWLPIASELTTEEIDVLEMNLEGFSDTRIGIEIGIGGRNETREFRKQLAAKFNLTVEELIISAPQILQLGLASRNLNNVTPQ